MRCVRRDWTRCCRVACCTFRAGTRDKIVSVAGRELFRKWIDCQSSRGFMKGKLLISRRVLYASALVILVSAAVRNVAAQYSRHHMPDHTTVSEIEVPFR